MEEPVKIAIVSGIHGNYDAWRAFPETYDELWVLGDLVTYGPEPREVLEDIQTKASIIIQGNHDYAVAHDDDSKWSAKYRELSTVTRKYTSQVINGDQKEFLRKLPLQIQVARDKKIFHLTHATVLDTFYGKWTEENMERAFDLLNFDILVCGHSHIPYVKEINGRTLLNPGSIGQSRSGVPKASYAIWQDGRVELKSYRYPIEATIQKIAASDFEQKIKTQLGAILKTARV